MASKGESGVISTKESRGIRMENPFTLKVGQVFTGFGIGCGIGIGVGRPLNLGAIPVLNQVMVATRGATDAFSVEESWCKELGFGHGFGVGLAVKPAVLHQIQSHLLIDYLKDWAWKCELRWAAREANVCVDAMTKIARIGITDLVELDQPPGSL